MYIYEYRTRRGSIYLVPENGGRCRVMYKDENLGSYHSPQAAADDVSGGHTFTPANGVDFADLDIPDNVNEWERKPLGR